MATLPTYSVIEDARAAGYPEGILSGRESAYAEWAEFHSRWIDSALASHGAPWNATPPKYVRKAVMVRTIASIVSTSNLRETQKYEDADRKMVVDVIRMGERGIPLEDEDAGVHATVATSTVIAGSTEESRETLP